MPIKFLLSWGEGWVFLEGGWKCQFYFYGRGDFSELFRLQPLLLNKALQIDASKEGKSAINLSNLGNFCQIWPQVI